MHKPLSISLALFSFTCCLAASGPGRQESTPASLPPGASQAPEAGEDPTTDREAPAVPMDPADAAWRALETRGQQSRAATSPGNRQAMTAAEVENMRRAAVDRLHDEADRWHDFEQKYPDHPLAGKARRQEVLTLLRAAFLGDDTTRTRREQLVEKVHGDSALSPAERCEVAAFAENLEVMKAHLPRPENLDAHERVARRMIAEFPEVPVSYESLFSIAKARSDESAERVAREMLAFPAAPPQVQADARAVLVRSALRNRRLAAVLADEPEAGAMLQRHAHRSIVLYSWASWSPRSIAIARRLSAEAPSGVALVGLNLDADPPSARTRAHDEGLAGDQLYDLHGRDGAIARKLGCNTAGLVLVTDPAGLVIAISAQRDLDAMLAALPRA